LKECDLCDPNQSLESSERQKTNQCKLSESTKTIIFFCDFLNQNKGWRKRSSIEIPIDSKTLEEEIQSQLQRTPKFLTKQKTDKFLEVEIQDIGIDVIEDNIAPGEFRENIIKKYIRNNRAPQPNTYQFYTDGSFGETSDHEKKMGTAWIQSKGPYQDSSLIAGVSDWPSAYRAELVAILLAILTVPQSNNVEIVIDSASCINIFNRLSRPDSKRTTRRWIKEKNWTLWIRLI
jgi:hypothetical protein